jgi:predicted HicB family RNase H-like nuclease
MAKRTTPLVGRPRSEQRQRTAFVGVRMLPAERQALREAAQARGVSIGELIRQALRNELPNPEVS